jgi:hypothetical protein
MQFSCPICKFSAENIDSGAHEPDGSLGKIHAPGNEMPRTFL